MNSEFMQDVAPKATTRRENKLDCRVGKAFYMTYSNLIRTYCIRTRWQGAQAFTA